MSVKTTAKFENRTFSVKSNNVRVLTPPWIRRAKDSSKRLPMAEGEGELEVDNIAISVLRITERIWYFRTSPWTYILFSR